MDQSTVLRENNGFGMLFLSPHSSEYRIMLVEQQPGLTFREPNVLPVWQ